MEPDRGLKARKLTAVQNFGFFNNEMVCFDGQKVGAKCVHLDSK